MKRQGILFLVIILQLMYSCNIEKRRYMQGYYRGGNCVQQEQSTNHTAPVIKEELLASENPGKETFSLSLTENQHSNVGFTQKYSDTVKCDEIILKKGESISAIVTDVDLDVIKYKSCDNRDGPKISLRKKEVFMIKYANGERMVMDEKKNRNTRNENLYRRGAETTEDKIHNNALLAFILGMLSVSIIILGPFFAIPALILGSKTKNEAGMVQQHKDYKLAKAGMILGILSLAFTGLFILILTNLKQ